MKQEKDIKKYVKERYGKIASEGSSCCPSSCCTPDIIKQAKAFGYSEQEIENLPEDTVMGLGCGNPTALAELKEGEIVMDLGSGGGIDVFLTAQKVGEKGKVIGVDMTPEMIQKEKTQEKETTIMLSSDSAKSKIYLLRMIPSMLLSATALSIFHWIN